MSYVYLGYTPGGSGVYNLTGGLLSSECVQVGTSGTGFFTQSGGTNTVLYSGGIPFYLYLGYNSGSSGTYCLSGTSLLSATAEYVGYSPGAAGVFQQTGGSNATYFVSVGSGGRFVLGGGTLNVGTNGGISSQGTFDGANGAAQLTAGSNCILDFSQGAVDERRLHECHARSEFPAVRPPGFDPTTGFGSYNPSPSTMVHVVAPRWWSPPAKPSAERA